MDDYRRIMLLGSLQEERAREIERMRQEVGRGQGNSWKTILVAVTVTLLGMIAWWGH